ncbi:MAG: hypothetical protein MUF40_07405 [Gemmatimonadaceae bacterium]|nr:hypothetical protein [Gemmatimonadaceae bacterium]
MTFARGARAALAASLLVVARGAGAQHLLVPMDDEQRNHLKAYGLTYAALQRGEKGEWLLNYRGGAFLLADSPVARRRAALDGITVRPIDDGTLATIRAEIAGANMDAVPLEKAPRIAIYTPPTAQPWDDAVTLALDYAGIPYTRIWDPQVLQGTLSEYEWLHLFHEDFTGQFNKFHLAYRGTPWFVNQVNRATADARALGFPTVPALKKAVAERIRAYVENGGFLLAMCGASETLELALAGQRVDIANAFADGTPVDGDADDRLDWTRAFAVRGAHLETNAQVNAMSDIDGHQVNVPGRRRPLGTFSLFAFSAKLDPVPTMLVQDHRAVLPDFYGVTTSFSRTLLKPGTRILGTIDGAPLAKYVHGTYGKGAFTYLGGHDPEDPQHEVGAPPTDLSLHPTSPGYRLILNNVLFPSAQKKPRKT